MTIRVQVEDVVAVWHGGEYIDLCFATSSGDDHVTGLAAFEVINVWDYEKGEPRIKVTGEWVRAEVKRWLREHREDMTDYRMSVGL